MPYIGNIPAEKYAAFNVQYFTTSATDTYTLDRAVANELDIRLVINNVIQEPGAGKAYTAAGTTLTLSAATAGSDTMYCVYIGKAVQTVNPGAGSVGTTALADNAVTNAKLADATQGDILYYGASGAPAQLSAGTSGYVLQTRGAGANPVWAVDAGGAALTGSTNNTITTVTGANAIQGEADLTFDGDSLLVKNGASGGSGANANANELVVENSDHGGISILTPYDKTGAIYFGDGSDDNIGMIEYPHDANCLKFTTNASERLRIDNAGKVGIGEDVPQQKLHIGEASSSGVYQVFTNDTTGHTASNGLLIGIDNSEDALIWQYEAKDIYFGTQGSERMRIFEDGQVGIAVTSVLGDDTAANNARLQVKGTSGAEIAIFQTASNGRQIQFYNAGATNVGSIAINSGDTNFTTSSDYRLKENIDYTWDATSRLKQLKPARFNFIADETNILRDGFIAHEVSSIVPEAISGEKDAINPKELYTKEILYTQNDELPEGKEIGDVKHSVGDTKFEESIKPQGIDQSKLVPLLVKTVQELEARIKTLENA